jgi:hypothetical protein
MWHTFAHRSLCPDGISRRAAVRAGFLGLAGLSLPDLLRAQALAGTRPESDRSVILVWLDGGPPQHETYDPKPDAPEKFRGPLKAIETKVPGIQVSELLPNHARIMDRIALIRSMQHRNQDHFAAAHWMLSGYLGSNAANQDPTHPSYSAVISRILGARKPGVPAYVGVGNTHSVGIAPGYHGPAFLGAAYGPFIAEGDPNQPGYKVPSLTLPAGLDTERLGRRHSLSTAFEHARTGSESWLSGEDPFVEQAFEMVTGPAARAAFELEKEDPRLRDRYGRHPWGQSALVARRLVEAGVRCVTLTYGGWDFHSSLDRGMRSVLPILDAAVPTLIEDLELRGLLDSTMVIVMGEFGRTPKMNDTGVPGSDPVPGRDHWGDVMSVLIAGGGLNAGLTVGASNPRGEVPKDRPISPADLIVTIYDRLGIDPDTTFYDKLKRPVPIGNRGQVIRELI